MPAKITIPTQNFHLNDDIFHAADHVKLKAEGVKLKAGFSLISLNGLDHDIVNSVLKKN